MLSNTNDTKINDKETETPDFCCHLPIDTIKKKKLTAFFLSAILCLNTENICKAKQIKGQIRRNQLNKATTNLNYFATENFVKSFATHTYTYVNGRGSKADLNLSRFKVKHQKSLSDESETKRIFLRNAHLI